MKFTAFRSRMTVILALVVGGCSTTNTSIRIAGTLGAQFTAQYRAGAYSGSVTTTTVAGAPETVLEMPGRGLTCEISKKDAADQLTVEISQGGERVYRAEAPAG